MIVKRRVGEKFHPDCVVPTVNFGSGSNQVWGCMCHDGVGSLHVVEMLRLYVYQIWAHF